MADVKKSSGSAKRLGVRYGRTTREKIGNIERTSRAFHSCPYCTKNTVRRLAAGIWQCRHCNSKFSGAAYKLHREIKSEAAEAKNG